MQEIKPSCPIYLYMYTCIYMRRLGFICCSTVQIYYARIYIYIYIYYIYIYGTAGFISWITAQIYYVRIYTATSGIQTRNNMTTMGKTATSDLMMIRGWVIISFPSPKLEWTSSTHTTPHIAQKCGNLTNRTDYILDTLSVKYTQQAFSYVSRIFHRMCSMQVG